MSVEVHPTRYEASELPLGHVERSLSFEDRYGPAEGGGALMGRTVKRRRDGAEGIVRQQRRNSVMVWCSDVRRNLTFLDGTYDIIR